MELFREVNERGKGRKIGASCVCNITRKKEAKMSREGRVRSGLGKDGEAFWEVGRSLASPRLVWLGGRKSYIRFKGFFLVRGGGFGWWWLSVSSSSSLSSSSLGVIINLKLFGHKLMFACSSTWHSRK